MHATGSRELTPIVLNHDSKTRKQANPLKSKLTRQFNEIFNNYEIVYGDRDAFLKKVKFLESFLVSPHNRPSIDDDSDTLLWHATLISIHNLLKGILIAEKKVEPSPKMWIHYNVNQLKSKKSPTLMDQKNVNKQVNLVLAEQHMLKKKIDIESLKDLVYRIDGYIQNSDPKLTHIQHLTFFHSLVELNLNIAIEANRFKQLKQKPNPIFNKKNAVIMGAVIPHIVMISFIIYMLFHSPLRTINRAY